MLIFAICWILKIYIWWLLMSTFLLEAQPLLTMCQLTNVLLCPFIILLLRISKAFTWVNLYLSPLNKCFIKIQISLFSLFHPSTSVIFQVECVWCLLSTVCTVKPCKPLVSLLFHCQWNHHDCMVSYIPMHCPFNCMLDCRGTKQRVFNAWQEACCYWGRILLNSL